MSLPESLSLTLSPRLALFYRASGYLSMTSIQMLPWSCLLSISYQKIMIVQTVLPLTIMIFSIVFYFVKYELIYLMHHRERDRRRTQHHRLTKTFATFIFLTFYIFFGGAVQMILGSFVCVNVDPEGVAIKGDPFFLRLVRVRWSHHDPGNARK